MSKISDLDRCFADWLAELAQKEDRAALAALRRGLGKPPGRAADMHPLVLRRLPTGMKDREEEPYYLIASLFAWHPSTAKPEEDKETNLGASFAVLREKEKLRTREDPQSVERRFVALLNCHSDDLPAHLRHAVGLLKSKDVPIDWAQLLHDFKRWDSESRWVQRRWARAFWGRREPPEPVAHAPSPQVDTPGKS